MLNIADVRRRMIGLATTDAEFRQRLVADPRRLIAEEFEIDIPEDIEVRIHEDSDNLSHLVLPPLQVLDDAELEAIAGGRNNYYW